MRLAIRAVTQSIAFFGLIGALLFIPAGTFDYVAAWLFVGAFAGSSIVLSVYLYVADRALFERRMAMGTRGEPHRTQQRIQSVMGLTFVAMLVTCGLDHRFGWSSLPRPIVVGANALIPIAFAMIFFVFRANTFTSSVVEVNASQSVVSTGPYRFVRHPMYSAALLLLAAVPIALGSWVGGLWIPIFYGGIVLRLLDEERILARDLSGYEAYTRQTRYRLIPYVW